MPPLELQDRQKWRRRLVFLFFLYLPVSMPWVVAQIYFTRTRWSVSGLLFRPDVWLLALLVLLAWTTGAFGRTREVLRTDRNLKWLLGLAVAFTVWSAVCSLIQGAFPSYWVRYLLLAWILPWVLATAMMADRDLLGPAWKGLAWGVAALLAFAVFLYVVSFGVPHSLGDVLFNRYVRAQYGAAGGVYFARLTFGDYNSVGVFFAAVAAFCIGLSTVRVRNRSSAAAWGMLLGSFAVVYIVYSRGSILALVAAALTVFAAAVIRRPPLARGPAARAAVVLVLFVVILSQKDARPHWAFNLGFAKGNSRVVRLGMWKALVQGRSDTVVLRTDGPGGDGAKQDQTVLEALRGMPAAFGPAGTSDRSGRTAISDEEAIREMARIRRQLEIRVGSRMRRYVFGVGIGSFGLLDGMSLDTGTHSLFLDPFASSGVLGFVLFAGFWALLGWRLFWNPGRPPDGDWTPAPLALFLAWVAVSVSGAIVNFRLDGLGILLPSCGVVLMALTARPVPLAATADRA